MTTFTKALLWTAVPLVALALISTGGVFAEGLYWVWGLGALGLFIGLLTSVGFGIARKSEVSSGVIVGCALGFLALAVSCYANLNTLN